MDALEILLKHNREDYRGMFKRRYPLQGKTWLRDIPPEDRAIFAQIGREYHGYGHLGGIARAKTAKRDEKGRFISE